MLKDIMAHLDGSANDAVRLAHATKIASLHGARLIGLYTNPLPEYAYVLAVQSGLAPMEPVIEGEERMRKNGDRVVADIEQKLAKLPVPSAIRRLDVGASQIIAQCVTEAQWADLFVAVAPYRHEYALYWDDLVEAVMFESGHGIYLIPDTGHPAPDFENVLIAWQPTREAARAIHEALPFLKTSKTVRLAIANPDWTFQAPVIVDYFHRHGVSVEIAILESKEKSVPDILLDEAHGMKAGLIVLGAYGHSRFREWVLGGTTREMIERSDIPLLMAH